MIKIKSNQHWYTRDGKPKHDADLRVARKEKLFTSPTSIEKESFKNYFLDNWKLNQLALAAAENPRQPHEEVESYANRINEISLQKTITAAEFGTKAHKVVEDYPAQPSDHELAPYYDAYHAWHEANVVEVLASETVIVDPLIGVAGRGDIYITHKTLGNVWVDVKTQGVKVDKKGRKAPAFYDSWPRQLAFYSITDAKQSGIWPDCAKCMSLVLDSKPGEGQSPGIYEKLWEPWEIKKAYRQFLTGAWLWFDKKNYWPGDLGEWGPDFKGIELP